MNDLEDINSLYPNPSVTVRDTDVITKLNHSYSMTADTTNGSIGILSTFNNTSVEFNLDGGIMVNGKTFDADEIEELFKLKEMIKKIYPELLLTDI